ncbi:MAG: hypothetical protein ABFD44_09495 [Anaerolineaceae bacterium]
MNTGSAIFFIIVILLGVFIGSGYLVSQQMQTAEDLESCQQEASSLSANESTLNGELQEKNKELTDITRQRDEAIAAYNQDHEARLKLEQQVGGLTAQIDQIKIDVQNARTAQQQAEAQVGWYMAQMQQKDDLLNTQSQEIQNLRIENAHLMEVQNDAARGLAWVQEMLQTSDNPLVIILETSAGWMGLRSLGYMGRHLRRRTGKTHIHEIWVRMTREEALRYGRSHRQG